MIDVPRGDVSHDWRFCQIVSIAECSRRFYQIRRPGGAAWARGIAQVGIAHKNSTERFMVRQPRAAWEDRDGSNHEIGRRDSNSRAPPTRLAHIARSIGSAMSQPKSTSAYLIGTPEAFEAWIHGVPAIDDYSIQLLASYREALGQVNLEEARVRSAGEAGPATPDSPQGEPSEAEGSSPEAGSDDRAGELTADGAADERESAEGAVKPPNKTKVTHLPRLHEVMEIEPERLSQLHGHLVAIGYLEEEILARSAGLAYRITRAGVSRLIQWEEEAASAA